MDNQRQVLLAVIIVCAIVIGWAPLILFDFGQWTSVGRIFMSDLQVNSEILRNLSFPIGGVVAVLIAVWRARAADKQNTIANEAHARELHKIDEERFQNAALGLGHEQESIRTASILSLGELAKTERQDFKTRIVKLLEAFARQRSSETPELTDIYFEDPNLEWPITPEDMLLAIKTITEVPNYEPRRLLRGLRLVGASFINFHFTNCDLSECDARFATFRLCTIEKSDLERFNAERCFINTTQLRETVGFHAILERARFHNCYFIDSNIDASRSTVHTLSECEFIGGKFAVDVSNAMLHGIKISGGSNVFMRAEADRRPKYDDREIAERVRLYTPTLHRLKGAHARPRITWAEAEEKYPSQSDKMG